ncbi:peptidylprolyl isomerase [Polaribacter sp.]|nr:peptidylprolyl isomerase [Polaribacter sp.]
MRKIVLSIITVCVSTVVFAQKDSKTLFTIDGEPTTVGEFKHVYEKNLDAIDDPDAKDVAKNLDLYINYKLKVDEAFKVELDTMPSYIREMETYRNQLSAPYLKDTTMLGKLVEDAYFRTANEVKAKHILIRLQNDALPKDTLVAYNKIIAIRNRIVNNGEDFEAVAVETSEDPSAKGDSSKGITPNKGNLGYFSAFSMVYPFEKAAYETKAGEVSMPFRSRFGYHILKVDEFRKSRGMVEAAHILIKDTTAVGKAKIDNIYAKLEAGESFEQLAKENSEDTGSSAKGGKLGKFKGGRMVKPFENAVFGLQEKNTYSKPFKTPFGWHIAYLIDKYPVASFNELEGELRERVKKSTAISISEKALISRLQKEYTIVENEDAKAILNRKNIRAIPTDSLQNAIFSIDGKDITQEEFVKYTRNRRHKPIFTLFEEFKNEEIINYYKEDLVNKEPEYASTIKEYEEGLLLFELMQQKIWNKSSQDTLGLQTYFNKNKATYKVQALDSIKGQVINDYQNFLEKEWIAELKSKHEIEVKKSQLKKLIKYYRKEN